MAKDKLSKDEWNEWVRSPVTERFLMDFQEKINSETWSLVEHAGTSTTSDAKSSGRIMAWGELLNWKPEEFMVDESIEFRDGGDDSGV